MAGEPKDRIERLELEIRELKEALATGGMKRKVEDISAQDLQAYIKVRDLIAADYGHFCGINDCFKCIITCNVCSTCRICTSCIFECSCGPCNLGGGLQGGMSRFRDLGG